MDAAPPPRMRFRDILPKGLYWRTLLIIVAPAALLQLIITLVFLDDHWQATSKRMSQGVAADVALIIQLYERNPTRENFEQLRRRTKRICQVLKPYGLRYGLEYVGPFTMRQGRPNPFIHNLDGLLELIAAVDEDNLGVLLDSYHWYTAGEDASDLARLSDDLVVVVHVNDAPAGVPRDEQLDNVRGMPGETGVIDIRTFLGALEKMGYTGPVMAEPFSERVRQLPPDEAVAATAESMNKIWQIAGLK